MLLTITDLAAKKISASIASKEGSMGIRLSTKITGCSGVSYVMDYVDTPEEGDIVFETKGVKLYSDAQSMKYIDGTEIDWKKEGLNEGFRFSNPNSLGECGCGESFSV